MFGPLLVVCTALNLLTGLGVIVGEFCIAAFPDKTNRAMANIKRTLGIQRKIIHRSSSVQPLPRMNVEVDGNGHGHAAVSSEARPTTVSSEARPTAVSSETRPTAVSSETRPTSLAQRVGSVGDEQPPVDRKRQQSSVTAVNGPSIQKSSKRILSKGKSRKVSLGHDNSRRFSTWGSLSLQNNAQENPDTMVWKIEDAGDDLE